MLRKTVLIAACCLGGVASAADNGFYLGAGLGQSDFDLQGALDNKDTGYKLIAGFRLLDSFGVEVNLADHGRVSQVEAQTAAAFAVGFLDFPVLDLFAKAGVSVAKGELRIPGMPSLGFSDTKTSFAWGAGAQAHFGSLAARAEYEQFKLLDDQDLGMVSVSLIYTLF